MNSYQELSRHPPTMPYDYGSRRSYNHDHDDGQSHRSYNYHKSQPELWKIWV